jgi:uncharacterized protein YegP (UPF0339 family)
MLLNKLENQEGPSRFNVVRYSKKPRGFAWVLCSANGHAILESIRLYSRNDNCKRSAQALKYAVLQGRFEIETLGKKGHYVALYSANGKSLGISNVFSRKDSALRAIRRIKAAVGRTEKFTEKPFTERKE